MPVSYLTSATAQRIGGWLITVLLAYGVVNTRLAVLETQRLTDSQRIERIEQKIDHVIEQHMELRAQLLKGVKP